MCALADLTRYRRGLGAGPHSRAAAHRKLLEDAQIKISAVLSELHGMCERGMMEALIAGQRDPSAGPAGQGSGA